MYIVAWLHYATLAGLQSINRLSEYSLHGWAPLFLLLDRVHTHSIRVCKLWSGSAVLAALQSINTPWLHCAGSTGCIKIIAWLNCAVRGVQDSSQSHHSPRPYSPQSMGHLRTNGSCSTEGMRDLRAIFNCCAFDSQAFSTRSLGINLDFEGREDLRTIFIHPLHIQFRSISILGLSQESYFQHFSLTCPRCICCLAQMLSAAQGNDQGQWHLGLQLTVRSRHSGSWSGSSHLANFSNRTGQLKGQT